MNNAKIFHLIPGRRYRIGIGFMTGMRGHIVATFQHYIVLGQWVESENRYLKIKLHALQPDMLEFTAVFDCCEFTFDGGSTEYSFQFTDHFAYRLMPIEEISE